MTTREIIESKLNFLVSQYNMEFSCRDDGGSMYSFQNQHGVFCYYEWAQFGEEKFSVLAYDEYTEINMFLRYPKILGEFNCKHKGIRWWFKDKQEDYWEMIAKIIELEIMTNGSLFGLPVTKTNGQW